MDTTSGNDTNSCIEWGLLLRKIHNQPLDSEEESRLALWLETPEHASYYRKALYQWESPKPQPTNDFSKLENEIFKSTGIYPLAQKRNSLRFRNRKVVFWSIAASVAAVLGVCIWHYRLDLDIDTTSSERLMAESVGTQEINPGGHHATLILPSGESVNLENMPNSKPVKDANGNIISIADGMISYEIDTNRHPSSEKNLNTLVVPRGGEYCLRLSDGSTVWLNSNSTLRFPDHFSAECRKISLEGEAFFEISNDKGRNFIIETSVSDVEVFGTSFNIRSYPNEKVQQTTLVKGRVAVRSNGKTVNLIPGEQARISKNDSINVVKVDTTEYCSWRNGLFIFEYRRLDDILAQLSDWYDVDFSYADSSLKELHFTGDLEKYSDFNDILSLIGMTTNIDFDVNGKHVVVKKRNNQ